MQVPGLQDTAELERLIGETARLSFHEVHQSVTAAEAKAGKMPLGYKVYPSIDKGEGEKLLREIPVVTGSELTESKPGFSPQTNEPIVEFMFNNSGARKFGKFTRENVGKPFAIVLDDKVISAPRINTAIEGGRGYIEGSFTPESSTKLAIQLKSGALPAKLSIVEKRTVGPSLGSDSIEAGKLAGIVGGIATIALTVLYYGTFGIFACIGLIVHGILTVALMSLFGSTLTLPGIAGLVLGIAMAVDANVLIYERIREEVRAGKTPIAAIDGGFKRAFVTIADSQLTTLACALVMFWLGAGPIRGFAVTLTIGICTSIFASVTVVRLLISTGSTPSRAPRAHAWRCRSREEITHDASHSQLPGLRLLPPRPAPAIHALQGPLPCALLDRHGALPGGDLGARVQLRRGLHGRHGRWRYSPRADAPTSRGCARSSTSSASARCRSRASATKPTC